MNRWTGLVVMCGTLLIICGTTQAQTAVTTTGGTVNSVPKFSGSGTVVNSAITESNGNVGIDTTSPVGMLDVGGIGGILVSGANLDANGTYSLVPLQNSGKMLVGWNRSQGAGEIDLISNRAYGPGGGFNFYDYTNSGVLNALVAMQGNGNVGIGTTSPGTKLEVNGNVKLTSGSGASLTFADGTVQSTAWTGSLCGGDYAESVDIAGERAQYEPGDVLVIDPAHPGYFLKSSTRYSRLVAGIYSTKPGLLGRRQTTDPKTSKNEVPMAMVGIVPTKVTDENGPIEVGDLLVTSSLSAHAMKGGDGVLPTGTVIGKALGSLTSGTGVIEVLVSLQ